LTPGRTAESGNYRLVPGFSDVLITGYQRGADSCCAIEPF